MVFIGIISVIIIGFWIKFALVEIKQIKEQPGMYFSDVWNYFDFLSLIINAVFVILLLATLI
jgi:hypothetical protein